MASSSSTGRSTRLSRRRRPGKILEPGRNLQSLHDMFNIVGAQLTSDDVDKLISSYGKVLPKELSARVLDGYGFLLALERIGSVDESNFRVLKQLLQAIQRHDLLPLVTLRKRKPVVPDPVEEYLVRSTLQCTARPYKYPTSASHTPDSDSLSAWLSQYSASAVSVDGSRTPITHAANETDRQTVANSDSKSSATSTETEIRPRETCDIRLRVRAEYCDHEAALAEVTSSKPTRIERQFEKFTRANVILKSRDLGTVVCDIKFSELTYLDAFWRDYINGSLQDALKTVFITDSLQQAVGDEPVRLVVSVDEDDYEAGRRILLRNLTDST